jgi:hypothetical protein
VTVIELSSEQDKTVHRAVVEYMLLDRDQALVDERTDIDYIDRRMRELTQEIEAIFGPDALEYSASYFTGGKFSSDDIVVFAAVDWEALKRVFRYGNEDS